MKHSDINDLDLGNWKQYDDLKTDSLWLIEKRDGSGGHSNEYHGNFVPQIPNQLMRRFTRKDDVVLDPFVGSGTSLIEAKRLSRNGIGIELVPEVADIAKSNMSHQPTLFDNRKKSDEDPDTFHEIIIGDSKKTETFDKVAEVLENNGKNYVHLIILHPPYHDIIKFSDKKNDLSNTESVEKFASDFGSVFDNFSGLLANEHYLAIVIGDKYTNSEWVPLGFYLMEEVKKRENYKLKSILVKNMANNRAKINRQNLWRYRALKGGFYVFKHEYILLFKKVKH